MSVLNRHWLRKVVTFALNKLARAVGMRIVNPGYHWYESVFHNRLIKEFDPNAREIHDRNFNLIELLKLLHHLDGDTAECDVYKGRSSFLIMKSLGNETRTHHIFDSFEGLSDPQAVDIPNKKNAYQWKGSDLKISEQSVRDHLSAFQQVSYHRGWIPDCFKNLKSANFIFVHIDVDLYQPTLDSLRFFYDRLRTGGMILCDDYGSTYCPGARKAFDEFMQDKPEPIIELTSGQCFIIKHSEPTPITRHFE